MRWDVGIEDKHSHRQSRCKLCETIHVWMLIHECLHDHIDDLFVLERLGCQVLLLLLGLPILCYLLLQADPALGTRHRLICNTQQQVGV